MANLMQVADAVVASQKRLAFITSLSSAREALEIQRTLHCLLHSREVDPEQSFSDRSGYRGSRVLLKNGSSIRFFNMVSPEALHGCTFDLIVYDDQVHPEVLAEAKKRVISNLSSVEGESNV